MNSRSFATMALLVAALAVPLSAAPARLITAPPVIKIGNPNTGPLIDPTASQGQWFQRPSGLQEVRPLEFYDNVIGEGGSTIGSGAIRGSIVNPQFAAGPGSAIVGFDIVATITNDLPGQGIGQPGRNSHGEVLNQTAPLSYQGTMYDVKLTAEFAMPQNVPAGTLAQIAANSAPYAKPPVQIISKNEDQHGWFCFAPINGAVGGDYLVPTWDFGNIAPGASVSKTLSFATNIVPTDASYLFFQNAVATQGDILLNRTTDLKIGDWVDALDFDTGVPYLASMLNSGNASVFFNVPEPTTISVLGGAAALMRRRRG